MSRKSSNTVDYFPHECASGRVLFILEQRWKASGYCFWFKMLEILGASDGHFYKCSSDENWEYLLARTMVDSDVANDILNTLARIGQIDSDLWNDFRVIWCQAFVDRLVELYRKRQRLLPAMPSFCRGNGGSAGISEEIITKVKQSKAKESTGEQSAPDCTGVAGFDGGEKPVVVPEKQDPGTSAGGDCVDALAAEAVDLVADTVYEPDFEDVGVDDVPVTGGNSSGNFWPPALWEMFVMACKKFGEDANVLREDGRRRVLAELVGDNRIRFSGFLSACEQKARSPGKQSITYFLDNRFEAVKRVTAFLAGGNGFVPANFKDKNNGSGGTCEEQRDIQRVAERYS